MSNDAKDVAIGLIETFNTSDPFELCNYLDIYLLFHSLGSEIFGFFQRTESGYELLHINNRLNYYTRKYICAHELGHAIIQPELSMSFFIRNSLMILNKFEIEADIFAAELLLNSESLKEYEGYTVEQVAAAENVPKRLVELKLNNLV